MWEAKCFGCKATFLKEKLQDLYNKIPNLKLVKKKIKLRTTCFGC